MGEKVLKNKLVLKDLGNPAKLASDKNTLVGTIVGFATGVGVKVDARDTSKVFHYLEGTFEGHPSDPESDVTAAGILYLPDGIFGTFAAPFRGENPPQMMEIALEVYVKKAGNPIGYEWGFSNKIKADTAAADPLKALRERAGLKSNLAISDGTKKKAAKK